MLVIREIEAADHIDGVMDMLRENWAETGFDFELRPNVDLVRLLQQRGVMFVLVAFDGEQLVGYSSAVLGPHVFNPDILTCESSALFVLPAWRKTSAGARLIAATEQAAKARGANRMLWHTRAGTPLAATLERRGYQPADVTVMKGI
jgi:GNAT superfamily N-acetyltransferase